MGVLMVFRTTESTQTLENGEERAIDTMLYQRGIERITETAALEMGGLLRQVLKHPSFGEITECVAA